MNETGSKPMSMTNAMTTVERRSDRKLVVTRTVNCPATLVFEAWKEALDEAIASGSTSGWGEQFDQLDELVVALPLDLGSQGQ